MHPGTQQRSYFSVRRTGVPSAAEKVIFNYAAYKRFSSATAVSAKVASGTDGSEVDAFKNADIAAAEHKRYGVLSFG